MNEIIGIQGIAGSFHHQVAQEYFDQNVVLDECLSFEELVDHVQAASPVPGGVGPMTIAMLLSNTCYLAERRAGI